MLRKGDSNSIRFQKNLKTLASGMLELPSMKTVSEIVYKEAIKGLDNYFFITFDKLFDEANKKGIDLKKELNENINRNNCWPFEKDNLTPMLKDNVINEQQFQYHIVVPLLDKLSKKQLKETPAITYTFLEEQYPIPEVRRGNNEKRCPVIEVPFLEESHAALHIPWWVIGVPIASQPIAMPCLSNISGTIVSCPPFPKWIRNCAASGPQCEVCPATNPASNTINRSCSVPGGGLDEIKIVLKHPVNAQDNCFADFTPVPSTSTFLGNYYDGSPNYATITALSGYNYYTWTTNNNVQTIQKLTYPIIDKNYQNMGGIQEGNVLTLCANRNTFNSYDEAIDPNQNKRFGFGYGGIYKIERLNQLALYFAYPGYIKEYWFSDGPDLYSCYEVNSPVGPCFSGKSQIKEDYNVPTCNFCDNYNVFGVAFDQIVTDELSTSFVNYWKDNVITVGVGKTTYRMKAGNFTDFNASNSSSTCPPPSLTLACQLFKTNDITYEVSKPFFSNQLYQTGDIFTVRVTATFSGGEKIDECKDIQLVSGVTDYSDVLVYIRGKILNYQVDVYKQ